SDAVRERLLERAGGLPFYLVSCAEGLHDAAATATAAHPDPEREVPWHVAQSIRQRVAALPAAAQILLGVAAAVGRPASWVLLSAVSGQSEEALLETLEAVCAARLLLERDADVYAFAHDLVREVVEGDLSATRCATLHRRVAAALEGDGATARSEHAAELANHLTRGGQAERALPYALRAGDQAEAVYAYSEAERHFRIAVKLARAVGATPSEGQALEK